MVVEKLKHSHFFSTLESPLWMGLKWEVSRPAGVIRSSVKSSFGGEAVCLDLGGSTWKSSRNSFSGSVQTLVVCFPSQGKHFVEKLFGKTILCWGGIFKYSNTFSFVFKIPKLQFSYWNERICCVGCEHEWDVCGECGDRGRPCSEVSRTC